MERKEGQSQSGWDLTGGIFCCFCLASGNSCSQGPSPAGLAEAAQGGGAGLQQGRKKVEEKLSQIAAIRFAPQSLTTAEPRQILEENESCGSEHSCSWQHCPATANWSSSRLLWSQTPLQDRERVKANRSRLPKGQIQHGWSLFSWDRIVIPVKISSPYLCSA